MTELARLKDRDLRRENLLVTEGRFLTGRLLDTSLEVVALACTRQVASEFGDKLDRVKQVEILEEAALAELAGFAFHRGVLACAVRPEPLTLASWLTGHPQADRLLILPDLTDPENLGSLYRTAAGLGWEAVAVGPESCDPWSRRALKVSMGGAFQLETIGLAGAGDLAVLQKAGWTLAAAVLSDQAKILGQTRLEGKIGLLIGNEARGLTPEWQTGTLPLTIPMKKGTDSLNAGVAGALFLYELRRSG